MPPLTADDFAPFYEQVHGHPPFPWQVHLARQILDSGRWPDVLDLPTGAGKTSSIDVALFTFAAAPALFPRRIVQVVDRRVVVDQGAEHARSVLRCLHGARHGPAAAVARALRDSYGGTEADPPFTVAVMRGGMPRDDAWVRRPDQPVVALSTVDQVGSRLLFRGYGVSERMAPVHAGLLGNDTLFLLDEVHLAIPFTETLSVIRSRWKTMQDGGLPDRWSVVRMSATVGTASETDEVFQLADADRQHPVLARRLQARKRARLEQVTIRGKDSVRTSEQFARACETAVREQLDAGVRTLAVVVNRVDAARETHTRILASKLDVDTVLLTGRMRPLDREQILDAELLTRIGSGRVRDPGQRPLVVVATQCIEVGADFDFDALVTECASLDALRQRFGRLDRLGDLGTSTAVILVRSDQAGAGTLDPVYGLALSTTWNWMSDLGEEIDFGIEHFPVLEPTVLETLVAPVEHAPILLPGHLDAWVQTSPRPYPDPDVSLWLHGPDRGRPEIQIVWRADIDQDGIERAATDPAALADLLATLDSSPPGSLEALTIPLAAARAWLAGGAPQEVTDVVGATDGPIEAGDGLPAVRWAGDSSLVVFPAKIAPGNTLVVPSAYGGISSGSWDPVGKDPVADLGDLVQWRLRGRATLRLHPAVLASCLPATLVNTPPTVPASDDVERDPATEVRDWLAAVRTDLDSPWGDVVAFLRDHRRIALPSGHWTLVSRHLARSAGAATTTEDDSASFQSREISLHDHCAQVQQRVEQSARALGLPGAVTADLGLAAWLHDVGKADTRFQRMLVGGSEIRLAILKQPLAKSAIPGRDLRTRLLARRRAGVPPDFRHELLSVALVQAHGAALAGAHDPDLVLYLIGSHHGHGRPFAPPVWDPSPIDVRVEHGAWSFTGSSDHQMARLDSGLADRFWDLVERYGWWGLAWLEALFRLADQRVSAEEQEVSR